MMSFLTLIQKYFFASVTRSFPETLIFLIFAIIYLHPPGSHIKWQISVGMFCIQNGRGGLNICADSCSSSSNTCSATLPITIKTLAQQPALEDL